MVCTVTTAMTTITTMAVITLPDSVGIAAAVALIILLAIGELAPAYGDSRLKLLRRYLLVVIIPLLFVFSFIMITEIMDVW
jgi:hypothetical protein